MVLLGILTEAARTDVRERRISNRLLAAALVLRPLLSMAACKDMGVQIWRELGRDLGTMALFALLALCVLGFTGAGIGFGDVKLVGVMIFYCGWGTAWRSVFCGFSLAALLSLLLMLLGKRKRRDRIPLAPYLLAGYISVCLWEFFL